MIERRFGRMTARAGEVLREGENEIGLSVRDYTQGRRGCQHVGLAGGGDLNGGDDGGIVVVKGRWGPGKRGRRTKSTVDSWPSQRSATGSARLSVGRSQRSHSRDIPSHSDHPRAFQI